MDAGPVQSLRWVLEAKTGNNHINGNRPTGERNTTVVKPTATTVLYRKSAKHLPSKLCPTLRSGTHEQLTDQAVSPDQREWEPLTAASTISAKVQFLSSRAGRTIL